MCQALSLTVVAEAMVLFLSPFQTCPWSLPSVPTYRTGVEVAGVLPRGSDW